MPRSLTIAAAIVALLAMAPPARANWSSDPTVNLAVAVLTGNQYQPAILADGFGGAWVAWSDERLSVTQSDIYVHHVLTAGVLDPQFPPDGLLVCAFASHQRNPVLASDGGSGVFVAWFDQHTAANNPDIYMQHVLASGTVDPTWPTNGAGVVTTLDFQNLPRMISDGSGGALVCWSANTFGSWNIYAQHMLAAGVRDPLWPGEDGFPVCFTGGDQMAPQLVSDGSGGMIVAWEDKRSGPSDIYALHVLGNGTRDPAFPAAGLPICTQAGIQEHMEMVSDGIGGAIIVWRDQRTSSLGDLFAQHLRSDGALDPAWPATGTPICVGENEQSAPLIVTDAAHGAIVGWMDKRANNYDIYAQHVLADGTMDAAWPVNGRALCTSPGDQSLSNKGMVPDGNGGALVAWRDARSGAATQHVYATHVLGPGVVDPGWPTNGRAVCLADSTQGVPSACSDGTGGLLLVWPDIRDDSWDVYAQRVAADGSLPVVGVGDAPSALLRLDPPLPNPVSEGALLRFTLPASEHVRLEIFDVNGRAIRRIADGVFAPGPHEFRWDLLDEDGRAVPEGVYLERLLATGRSESRRLVVLRRNRP